MKDPELIVLNFRGQLQCRRGKTRGSNRGLLENLESESPGKRYGKSLENTNLEKSFPLMRRELEAILERCVLPATIPGFPTIRRMTLGMNSPMLVPSVQAREVVERQQRGFTHGRDPLFIGYAAATYFHKSEIRLNS